MDNEKGLVEYIECGCHTELLQLEFDVTEEDKDQAFLYIAFYSYGIRNYKWPLQNKIRHIWNILRYGTPFSDQIVLRKPERLKLKEFLKKIDGE